jgi:hypothetical protein
MKKGLFIIAVIAMAIITYFGVHRSVTMEARAVLRSECPELAWLKREYALSDHQFGKIQELHNLHDVECQNHCRALATTQQELQKLIISEPLQSPPVQNALQAWRNQQVISQDSILKHMENVSNEMDLAQGRRYRENVYRSLILSGRTPHINSGGQYNPEFILHLKP